MHIAYFVPINITEQTYHGYTFTKMFIREIKIFYQKIISTRKSSMTCFCHESFNKIKWYFRKYVGRKKKSYHYGVQHQMMTLQDSALTRTRWYERQQKKKMLAKKNDVCNFHIWQGKVMYAKRNLGSSKWQVWTNEEMHVVRASHAPQTIKLPKKPPRYYILFAPLKIIALQCIFLIAVDSEDFNFTEIN